MAEMTSEISMKPSMQNEYKDKQQQTIVDLNNRDINHLNDILKDVVRILLCMFMILKFKRFLLIRFHLTISLVNLNQTFIRWIQPGWQVTM